MKCRQNLYIDQALDAQLAEHGPHDFAAGFLADAGFGWAAALLADFPDPQAPQAGEV